MYVNKQLIGYTKSYYRYMIRDPLVKTMNGTCVGNTNKHGDPLVETMNGTCAGNQTKQTKTIPFGIDMSKAIPLEIGNSIMYR